MGLQPTSTDPFSRSALPPSFPLDNDGLTNVEQDREENYAGEHSCQLAKGKFVMHQVLVPELL